MNPYYHDDKAGITIYHGDCREVLPHIQADAVITDPPYKTRASGVPIRGRGVAPRRSDTAAVGMPWGYSLEWISMLSPRQWVVYCNYQMLGDICSTLESRAILGCVFTWLKPNAPRMTRPVPRLDCEFVVWARAEDADCGQMGKFKSMVINVAMPQAGCFADERLVEAGGGKAIHPTQKPIAVVMPFVDRLRFDVALDPFMGTGTTLDACKRLGRRAIGIEIDERYCEIAARRLSQEVMVLDDA